MRYEYAAERLSERQIGDDEAFLDFLRERHRDGWEYVSESGTRVVFRRQVLDWKEPEPYEEQ